MKDWKKDLIERVRKKHESEKANTVGKVLATIEEYLEDFKQEAENLEIKTIQINRSNNLLDVFVDNKLVKFIVESDYQVIVILKKAEKGESFKMKEGSKKEELGYIGVDKEGAKAAFKNDEKPEYFIEDFVDKVFDYSFQLD